jgi:hypothetical protein
VPIGTQALGQTLAGAAVDEESHPATWTGSSESFAMTARA